MLVDDIEVILLRSIVEQRQTCRQAAEAVTSLLMKPGRPPSDLEKPVKFSDMDVAV